jgi:hypothetical protein
MSEWFMPLHQKTYRVFTNPKVTVFAKALEASVQLRPTGVLAGGPFLVDLTAFGAFQSVPLQIQGLVSVGDAGVADAYILNLNKPGVFRT